MLLSHFEFDDIIRSVTEVGKKKKISESFLEVKMVKKVYSSKTIK